jgi:hypothetical protein
MSEWIRNLGHNWKDAPQLKGQLHHFPGLTGVDLDMFIATPTDPQIITDAASTGKIPYNIAGLDMVETQQLVRISQPPGQGYLTLFSPRWPGSTQLAYRTIADGNGVAIDAGNNQDRLFLAADSITFKDSVVDFSGYSGFARVGKDAKGKQVLRLMVDEGQIAAGGITMKTQDKAALLFADGKIKVVTDGKARDTKVTLGDTLKGTSIAVEEAA